MFSTPTSLPCNVTLITAARKDLAANVRAQVSYRRGIDCDTTVSIG